MKRINKKGVSVVVGYVLLITFGIIISVIVYSYLKSFVPSDTPACPDGVSIFVRNYSYDCTTGVLNLTLENNGKFNINGYFAHGSTNPNATIATEDFSKMFNSNRSNNGTTLTGAVFFYRNTSMPFVFGDKTMQSFTLTNRTYTIEIIPARFQMENNVQRFAVCGGAQVTQELSCN